jgi:hypothetical protein
MKERPVDLARWYLIVLHENGITGDGIKIVY